MKTVAVFFGGRSNEREISVITGTFAVNLLKSAGYNAVPVYLDENNVLYSDGAMNRVEYFRDFKGVKKRAVAFDTGRLVWAVKPKKTLAIIDCALNCCHGGMGEDGTLAAMLAFHRIPSASPDTPVSAAFMDKTLSKICAEGLHIPTLPSVCVEEGEGAKTALSLGLPLIIKPARLGSSIGIKIARDKDELSRALEYAFRLDGVALVEKYLPDRRDINCAAYRKNGEIVTSACEEVFSENEILTFSEKYEGKGTRQSKLPAELDKKLAEKIQEYTRSIYAAFRVRGVVRADFLVSGKEVYFNELNTVPGSLACYLFGEKLTEERDFLVSLVEEALAARGTEKELIASGILNDGIFSGSKGCKGR